MKSHRFEDPSRSQGKYEGDLKYGRCNGKIPIRGKDFDASPDQTGEAANQPVVSLVPALVRDPNIWQKDTRIHNIPSRKKFINSEETKRQIFQAAMENRNGLVQFISRLR